MKNLPNCSATERAPCLKETVVLLPEATVLVVDNMASCIWVSSKLVISWSESPETGVGRAEGCRIRPLTTACSPASQPVFFFPSRSSGSGSAEWVVLSQHPRASQVGRSPDPSTLAHRTADCLAFPSWLSVRGTSEGCC